MPPRSLQRGYRSQKRGWSIVWLVPLGCLAISGCGSGYTVVDRSHLVISDNARVSARNVTPVASRNAAVVEHLALATEVYQRQLSLLKERRNKVRGRQRTLQALSYATLAATAAGVSTWALLSDDSNAASDFKYAGAAATGGLVVGTTFQVSGAMQEQPEAVDEKIRHLESLYDNLLARLRALDSDQKEGLSADQVQAKTGVLIEDFIASALRIHVKG